MEQLEGERVEEKMFGLAVFAGFRTSRAKYMLEAPKVRLIFSLFYPPGNEDFG